MRGIFFILIILSMAACSDGQTTPAPVTATVALPSPTIMPGTFVPTDPPSTSSPTEVPATELPPPATTFPDPGAYDWQTVLSGLERPVDLQADGSGRLFIIEKVGRIRILQDGQL